MWGGIIRIWSKVVIREVLGKSVNGVPPFGGLYLAVASLFVSL